jgi:hypothetical protein
MSVQSRACEVLVARPQGTAFAQAQRGMVEELSEACTVRVCEAVADSLQEVLQSMPPDILVLMDNTAVDAYRRALRRLGLDEPPPVVAALAVDIGASIKGLPNATGIAYEVPIVTSVVALRSALGMPVSRVGIVHRKLMTDLVGRGRAFCAKEDVEVVSIVLPDTAADYAPLLRKSVRKLLRGKAVDVLWIPNDNVILQPRLIRSVWARLLARHRVPAIVGARTLVDPALRLGTFAVVPDHVALGGQLAAMIEEIRDADGRVGETAVEPPVSVKKFVNLRSARRLGRAESPHLGSVDSVLSGSGLPRGDQLSYQSASPGLSLAALLNMQVTSVTKRPERMMDVPTSIYVISREDIRRSGATRLQDLLGMVPGAWTIDNTYSRPLSVIREIPNPYPQSVSILMDGVPVISPIAGGLDYGWFDIDLSQVKRIEVIKGSGGTVYGANSATGVINVITRSAKESQGLRARLEGGTRQYLASSLEYGRSWNDRRWAHVSGSVRHHKGYDKNPDFRGDSVTVPTASGEPERVANRFNHDREGRRRTAIGALKIGAQANEKLRLSGGGTICYVDEQAYSSLRPDTFTTAPSDSAWLEDTRNVTGILRLRADQAFGPSHHAFAQASGVVAQGKYPGSPYGSISLGSATATLEAQDNVGLFTDRPVSTFLSVGASCRMVHFMLKEQYPGDMIGFVDPRETYYVIGGFLQNKTSLGSIADVIVGAKAETWTLLAIRPEILPNVRAVLKLRPDMVAWGAWSRSTTIPGYIQTNLEARQLKLPPARFPYSLFYVMPRSQGGLGLDTIPDGAGHWVSIVNSKDIRPTDYRTTEGGVRLSCIPRVSLDAAGFFTLYRDKIEITPHDLNTVIPSPTMQGDSIVPVYYANILKGRFYGTETVLRAEPFEPLRLELSHTWFRYTKEGQKVPGTDTKAQFSKSYTQAPQHVLRWRLYLDLPPELGLTLNGLWHSKYRMSDPFDYVNQTAEVIPGTGIQRARKEARLKLDFGIEKRFFNNKLRLWVWGRNVFTDHTIEAYSKFLSVYPHTVHRTFGGGLSYRF